MQTALTISTQVPPTGTNCPRQANSWSREYRPGYWFFTHSSCCACEADGAEVAPGVTRTPPRAKYLGHSGQLRVGKSPAPQAGEAHRTSLLDLLGFCCPHMAVPLTWEQTKMNSGFRSMSCTAVTQLRAHFRTVSLKGQSQARWGGAWRVEGKQQAPHRPPDSPLSPSSLTRPSLGL